MIDLSIQNIADIISVLSPLLVTFLLVMITLINQNLKGLVYLSGILVASFVNLILGYTLRSKKYENASPLCDFMEPPFIKDFNVPLSSATFHAFTLAYMIFPMYDTKKVNVPLIVALVLFILIDSARKFKNRCTNIKGIISGLVLGGLLGYVWYAIFKYNGHDSLLYYSEFQSNNVQCSRPSDQKFKCTVYQNGQVISEL